MQEADLMAWRRPCKISADGREERAERVGSEDGTPTPLPKGG
jgi:hypothetical protein